MEQARLPGVRVTRCCKSLAADPDSAKGIYQLSLVYARLGDDAEARKHVDLYQAKLREQTERISELRAGGTLAPARPPGRASTPAPKKAVPNKKDHQ